MKKDNYLKGRLGESKALELLEAKGYRLMLRNYKNLFGEIDLIMEKDGLLIFVEVKAKYEDNYGTPEEMIDKRKMRKIRRTAELFLLEINKVVKGLRGYRIDGVCMVFDYEGRVRRITHYENIEV